MKTPIEVDIVALNDPSIKKENCIDYHKLAASHCEEAAKFHHLAARQQAAGEFDQAYESMVKAQQSHFLVGELYNSDLHFSDMAKGNIVF